MSEETGRWNTAKVYDGGPGFSPGGSGRAYIAKHGHPPIDCPEPRMMAGLRGLYRCPGCGAKVRLASREERILNRRARPIRMWWSVRDGARMAWKVARDTVAGLQQLPSRVVGGVLLAAALLGFLALEGWIPR